MSLRKAYSYIRMSTDIQIKGDSLRRQLDSSEIYAKNNQLELVDSIDGIKLKDIGVSAFKGKNTQIGVLSLFLDALEKGKIKPDSVLLVESLDRLSRDKLSQALNQFMRILEKGIEIITLSDNQKYTQEIINTNPASLFISLSIMFRANEESEIKSKRLSSAWANKRANTASKVLTKTCPAWLEYSEEEQNFKIKGDRGEIVKKIFDMCINSCGYYTIAKYLNENKIPVFGKGKFWYISYIKKIIINRAVIGEFQPHKYIEGKRQKTGDPVINYFPKLVDEQTYLLAQVAISRRVNIGKGRKGTNFTNVFSGITYCGSCGSKMMLRSRGGVSKSSKYLLCSNQLVKAGCQMSGWNLTDFEFKLFNHLRELNFETLIYSESEDKRILMSDKVEAISEKLKTKETEINRAIDLLLSSDISNDIKLKFEQKIKELEFDKEIALNELKTINQEISDIAETKNIFNKTEIKKLIHEIEDKKENYMFRSELNQYLTKMITKIELYEPTEEFMPWEYDEDSPEIRAFRKTFKIRQTKSLDKILETSEFNEFRRIYNRTLKIKYKTGAERYLMWGDDVSIPNNDLINYMNIKGNVIN